MVKTFKITRTTLLGCKITNTAYGQSPIHLAAEKDSDLIADILIKHDAASISLINVLGEEPLHTAAKMGSLKCLEMFLKKGVEIDAKSITGDAALHLAVLYGRAETVEVNRFEHPKPLLLINFSQQVLLEHKAPIQIQNQKFDTPLHLAALFGHKSIVELLLEKGASIEEGNLSGWTPLHCAVFGGWIELIKPLFKAGFKTKNLETPLHIAAYSGCKKIVEAVLDCEKDTIDSVDHNGCTALFVAALRGNDDTVEFLLNGKNNQRKTNATLILLGEQLALQLIN